LILSDALQGVNPITQFFQGPNHANVSSVDLSSFAEDANHDESTKDSSSLKEEYMDDITENNVGGIAKNDSAMILAMYPVLIKTLICHFAKFELIFAL
jgi:hypothetical protein